MKRPTFKDPDMMVRVLRRRRPVLTAWLLGWTLAAVWAAIIGIFYAVAFKVALACLLLAAIYFLRIVRVNKRLEELE